MSIFSKKEKALKPKFKYRGITVLARPMTPILRIIYYALILCVLLAGIVALIMLFVNVPVEDMMLPPFMTLDGDTYSITIGNGIRIDCAYDSVTLGDIKTVIYAELMMFAAISCILAPTALFLSRLLKNVSHGEEYSLQNARYISYIGLCITVGSTFVRLARSFYNYLLVKTFVSDPDAICFAFELDLGGIATGVLIIVLAYIYGHVCEKHIADMPVKAPTSDVMKM